MDIMKKILNELKTYLDNASPEELKQAWKEVEQFENVGPVAKDFTKQYQQVVKSDWFMKAHQNKSDGCVKETETKPKHLFLKKDMSFEDGKLYRCTKIKSKGNIAYVDLEEVKNNPKEVEYSTMLQSIWGKICELEGKLGDIYNAISKPYQPYQDIPQSIKNTSQPMQCWFPDGTCMNPYHDCVNCPRPNVGRYTTTSDTNLTEAIRTMED